MSDMMLRKKGLEGKTKKTTNTVLCRRADKKWLTGRERHRLYVQHAVEKHLLQMH
jgi:hypothetical protein